MTHGSVYITVSESQFWNNSVCALFREKGPCCHIKIKKIRTNNLIKSNSINKYKDTNKINIAFQVF